MNLDFEWENAKASDNDAKHAIAIEEADALAACLIGVEISEIAGLVTDANRRMQERQDQ